MNRISIGTNLIENCENPLVILGRPLFSFRTEPDGVKLTFQLSSPPADTEILVENNKTPKGDIDVRVEGKAVSISLGDKEIFSLRVLDEEMATVFLDLRPVGLAIYTDEKGLYVGGSQLSGIVFKNCKNAIVIGG